MKLTWIVTFLQCVCMKIIRTLYIYIPMACKFFHITSAAEVNFYGDKAAWWVMEMFRENSFFSVNQRLLTT